MEYPPPLTPVQFRGVTIDARTRYVLLQVEKKLGFELDLTQGHNPGGVDASGGTHDRWGVVDVSIYDPSGRGRADLIVLTMREHGLAAWHRTPAQGPWGHHIHAVDSGCTDLAWLAQVQLESYARDDNALSGDTPDDGPRTARTVPLRPLVYPPLPTVSLENVQKQARNGGTRVTIGVRRVQRSLNAKLDTDLTIDGRFGAKTKAAYARWEKKIGGDGDGIPGKFSLTELGEGRFKVRLK